MELTLNMNATCNEALATHVRTVAKATPSAMETCGVSLAFGGHRVLDDVSFRLPPATITLLRGENGSGKTTLLNVINGFIVPDSGAIHFNLCGRRTVIRGRFSPERVTRAGVGRLWQDIRLFPTMSAVDNVMAATPALAAGNLMTSLAAWPVWRRTEAEARERAMHNLKLVDMAHQAASSCDMLSVGQMKRVAIARLLQAEAELLLLDEPLAGLDRKTAPYLLSLLVRLRDEYGKTVLVVEHQYEHMQSVCDQSLLLANGCLTEQEKIK